MADYRDRLRTEIILTSPEGNIHTAIWRGDPYTQDKKIGIFDFPNVAGSIAQDFNIKSSRYSLSIAFTGADNDLNTTAFMKSLSEKGVWIVVHPVLGLLKLQPLSFSPDLQPTKSGGITNVDTEWIEPLDLAVIPSASELQATIKSQIDALNGTSSDQLNSNSFQDTAEETASFRSSTLDVVAATEQFLNSISKKSATITAQIDAIKRDIDSVLAVVPLDVISVAGQLQQLIQLPARATQDVASCLDAYSKMASEISLTMTPDTLNRGSYNRVAIQELALTSIFGAVADISSTGELISRPQAVEVVEGNLALFRDATEVLDASQTLFESRTIDSQYFSQSQSFSASSELNALTVAYLLRSAFDLAIEKRFVLATARNPMRITIEEYGSLGEGDSNLDLFLETNGVHGNDILMIPAGRELVVYV